MKYLAKLKALLGDNGFLKTLECPLNKKWEHLQILDINDPKTGKPVDLKRHCSTCGKNVVNISQFDQRQVEALLTIDPQQCLYATSASPYIEFIDDNHEETFRDSREFSCVRNRTGLPIIKTARTINAMNEGAKEGLWPLIKPVEPDPQISPSDIWVLQNPDGTIETWHPHPNEMLRRDVMTFPGTNAYTSYYPFAAYLIPPELVKGDRVFIPDLIEDKVGGYAGPTEPRRLQSGYATWTGDDLELEYEPPSFFVG